MNSYRQVKYYIILYFAPLIGKTQSFEDEYRALLKEHGVEVDERYIF